MTVRLVLYNQAEADKRNRSKANREIKIKNIPHLEQKGITYKIMQNIGEYGRYISEYIDIIMTEIV